MAVGKRVTHFIPDHSDVWLLYSYGWCSDPACHIGPALPTVPKFIIVIVIYISATT